MAYVTPRVEITQDFTQTPAFSTNPLSAFIIGPQYNLNRFGVAAEQPLIAAQNPDGSGDIYNPAADVVYPYPNQVAGTTPDTSYTKVYIENLEAQYLPNTSLGSNSGNAAVALVQTAGGATFPNYLRFTNGSGTVAKTANGYNRSNYFSNRDVQVGDVVTVTDNLSNTITTTVAGLLADTVVQDGTLAATVGVSIVSHSDGVANGSTTFTSASGAFTSALIGKHLSITTKGTYVIQAVASATSLTVDRVIAAGSTLVYHIGGVFNDLANVQPQATVITNVPAYAWTGSGSDPTAADVTLDETATTAYTGYPAKRIFTDTYTATVTAGTNLSTARFSITSSQGAFTTKTNVALVSSILTLDNSGDNVVEWDFTGTTAFSVGQQWTVTVKAAVTLELPTAGGTYSGATDNSYKLTVTRGGPLYTGSNSATCATIAITSTNIDSSPTVLPVASTAFNVGTLGVTASFSAGNQDSQLILGDVFYIECHAAKSGAFKTLVLADSLPSATISLSSSISVVLSLVQASEEIPSVRDPIAQTVNWVSTTSALTLKSGLTTTDSTLLSGITPVALTVLSGNVYIQHRDLVLTNVNSIGSVTSTSQIAAILGTIDPDNEIAQAVYEAANNAVTVPVYFLAVATDDIAGYTTALGIAEANASVYSVVPTTFDSAIQQAVVGHVNAMSTPTNGRWRIAWFSLPLVPSTLLYDLKSDSTPYTATVTDDPVSAGTQYTLVTVAGAKFITDGVRPNDQVLINFGLSPDGSIISDVYNVVSVRTQTTLIIDTALSAPINVATKVQISRVYTNDEQINNLAAKAASFANRRVRVVFPDTCQTGSIVKNGYFLAAALAGLRSGVVPHQGITNTEILGFDNFTKTVSTFTSTQLDTLAASGVLIVTQSVLGAVPYVRHQLTTDMSSILTQEDSIVTNVDATCFGFNAVLSPYTGKYNNNTGVIKLINDALAAKINYYQTTATTATAGPQLLDGSAVLSVAADPLYKDRINIALGLFYPAPVNYQVVDLQVN